MFRSIKVIIFIFFGVFISLMLLRGYMVFNALNSNRTMYEVNVNSFNRIESYITTEYQRDSTTGCLKFKDEFGIKHIVCNNYTITEY